MTPDAISRADARELAALEPITGRARTQRYGWLYLFLWAGMPA